eukprot:COSAG01_NODE_1115_length_11643_cov_197.836798_6_plen_123_part_00
MGVRGQLSERACLAAAAGAAAAERGGEWDLPLEPRHQAVVSSLWCPARVDPWWGAPLPRAGAGRVWVRLPHPGGWVQLTPSERTALLPLLRCARAPASMILACRSGWAGVWLCSVCAVLVMA